MYSDRISAIQSSQRIFSLIVALLVALVLVPAPLAADNNSWWNGVATVTRRDSWAAARNEARGIARKRALGDAIQFLLQTPLTSPQINLLENTLFREPQFFAGSISNFAESRSGRVQAVRLWLSVDMRELEARLIHIGLIHPWDDTVQVVSVLLSKGEQGWIDSEAYPEALTIVEKYLVGYGIRSLRLTETAVARLQVDTKGNDFTQLLSTLAHSVSGATDYLLWQREQVAVPKRAQVLLRAAPQRLSYRLFVRPKGEDAPLRQAAQGQLATSFALTATGTLLQQEKVRGVGEIAPLIRYLYEVRRDRQAPWQWQLQLQNVPLLEGWELARNLAAVPAFSEMLPARIEPEKGPAMLLLFYSSVSAPTMLDTVQTTAGPGYTLEYSGERRMTLRPKANNSAEGRAVDTR